jgi:superfamily II DNA/RNA helicase
VLIDCSGPPDEAKNEATGQVRKREALMAQLDRRSSVMRTLIFCNTIQSCREVSETVVQFGTSPLPLHYIVLCASTAQLQ